MKRILSLVLALVMVLGTFTAVLAEDVSTEAGAGALLEGLGVLQGSEKEGLMLDKALKREQAVVMISRLMGDEDVAKDFPGVEEILTYEDLEKADPFYLPYLAWAYANKSFEGHSPVRFGYGEDMTGKQYLNLLITILGYERPAWEDVMERAVELGLVENVEEFAFTRGTMARLTVVALNTKMKDSTATLAESLEIEMPGPELSTDIEITAVAAVANNKVEVKVEEEVNASAADFAIVVKATGKAVEIKGLVKESAKVFVLETEALVGGTSYTLTSNEKTLNFTGLSEDTTAPTVKKVSGVDTNKFEVEYSDRMDFDTATNVANYTMNKDVKVVSASLNASRTKVTLITDAAKRNIIYTLTIENVTNSDGKAIVKVSRTVVGNEDRIAPRLTRFMVQNNRMIVLEFSDANGMDKAALETVANYSINDLEILSATAYDIKDDDVYDTVVLMTGDQVVNKAYNLTMENLVDGSVLANQLGKTVRAFRGVAVDKIAPTVNASSIISRNNNLVEIDFNEYNALDIASAEDISNYIITYGNEVLPIFSAKVKYTTYPDSYTDKTVVLTTAQQDKNKSYKIEVRGVQDEFANALKPISGSNYAKYSFIGTPVDTTPPYVKEVQYVDNNTVKLIFDDVVTNATDPTSYVINKEIGSAIKASVTPKTNKKGITLTTQELKDNVTYTLTINNVEDEFGNMLADVKVKFVATASRLDTTAPSMTYMYAPNNEEVHINFDESVEPGTTKPEIKMTATVNNATHNVTLNQVGIVDDSNTLVFKTNDKLKNAVYTIVGQSVSGKALSSGEILDTAGNKFVQTIDELPELSGNSSDNVPARIVYIEQVNVKKIKVMFDKPVKAGNALGYTASKTERTDDTHLIEWYFTKDSGLFKAGEKVLIDFTLLAKDLVGAGVWDEDDTETKPTGKTEWVPYLDDQTKPFMVSAVALNKKEVLITYDEDLDKAKTPSYQIYRKDDRNNKVWVTRSQAGTVDKDNLNTVLVTIPASDKAELSSEYIYFIEPLAGAYDIAGNREDTRNVVLEFAGSDITVYDFITGVALINATTIRVDATKAMKTIVVHETDSDGPKLVTSKAIDFNTAETSATLVFKNPVLEGFDYLVKVVFKDDTTGEYVFEGRSESLGFEILKTGSAKYELKFGSYVADAFLLSVMDANGLTIAGISKKNLDDAVRQDISNGSDIGDVDEEVYIALYDTVDEDKILYSGKVTITTENETVRAADAWDSVSKAAIALSTSIPTSTTAINLSLALPATGANGVTITWATTTPAATVAGDFLIDRSTTAGIELTASLEKLGQKATVVFNITRTIASPGAIEVTTGSAVIMVPIVTP